MGTPGPAAPQMPVVPADSQRSSTARAADDAWEGDAAGPAHTQAIKGVVANKRCLSPTEGHSKPFPTPAYGDFEIGDPSPPYNLYHDAKAYYLVMLLPGVEPARCWTQVHRHGLVEINYSMFGNDSLWFETEALKLRRKGVLASYLPDCLAPQDIDRSLLAPAGSQDDAEASQAGMRHIRVQLPISEHGAPAFTLPEPTGQEPKTSLRLGVYKAKLYKLPADWEAQDSNGPAA